MSKEEKKSVSDEKDLDSLSVEEGFKILEDTVHRLSGEDISLEESFKEFEKGMKVLKAVNDRIDRVEKKVRVITEGGEYDFQ